MFNMDSLAAIEAIECNQIDLAPMAPGVVGMPIMLAEPVDPAGTCFAYHLADSEDLEAETVLIPTPRAAP